MTSSTPSLDFSQREQLRQLQNFTKFEVPKLIPGIYENLSPELIDEVATDVLSVVLYGRFPAETPPKIKKGTETETRLACREAAKMIGDRTSKDVEMILRFLPLYVRKAKKRRWNEKMYAVRNVRDGLIPTEAYELMTEPDESIDDMSFPYHSDAIDVGAIDPNEFAVPPYDDDDE